MVVGQLEPGDVTNTRRVHSVAASGFTLPPLDRATFTSLSDHTYMLLEEAIIQGALDPGTHLEAVEIARQLGISRIPVREALRALQAHGWVVIRPRHGAFVCQRTQKEAAELFHVRAVLEAEAARLAAVHRTEVQLMTLSEIVQEGTRAAKNGDSLRLSILNTRFHAQLAMCTGNDTLAGLLSSMSKRIQWYHSAVVAHRGTKSWREHWQLLTALRRGDAERAARLSFQHSEATRTALQEIVERPRFQATKNGSP
jgi:DNA-binding GntR family transcriptional regulator